MIKEFTYTLCNPTWNDKIQFVVEPCCEACISDKRDFFEAVEEIHVAVDCVLKNNHVVRRTVARIYRLEASAISEKRGLFFYTIDFDKLLPHAPGSTLFVKMRLSLPDNRYYPHVYPEMKNLIVQYMHGETLCWGRMLQTA